MSSQSKPPGPPLTPTQSSLTKVPSGVHAMRRNGARHEVSERVTFKTEDGRMLDGWALNMSRGGLRAIVEDKVILGQKLEIALGAEGLRTGRVVWVQEEPDGAIVGIEFANTSGTHKSVPPSPPGAKTEQNPDGG